MAAAGDGVLNRKGDPNPGESYVNRGVLYAGSLNGVIDAYRAVCGRYRDWRDNTKAEKVLAIFFQRNLRHIKGFHDTLGKTSFVGYGSQGGDISFTGNPALYLDFTTLYQIDGDLYREHAGRFIRYASHNRPFRVMPWSQEREDFFARTIEAFEGLICRVELFCDDAEANMDRAIAAGAGITLLSAPKIEEEG